MADRSISRREFMRGAGSGPSLRSPVLWVPLASAELRKARLELALLDEGSMGSVAADQCSDGSGEADDSGGDDEGEPPTRPPVATAAGGSNDEHPALYVAIGFHIIAILALLGSFCVELHVLIASLPQLDLVDTAPLCGLMCWQLRLIHGLLRDLTQTIREWGQHRWKGMSTPR